MQIILFTTLLHHAAMFDTMPQQCYNVTYFVLEKINKKAINAYKNCIVVAASEYSSKDLIIRVKALSAAVEDDCISRAFLDHMRTNINTTNHFCFIHVRIAIVFDHVIHC